MHLPSAIKTLPSTAQLLVSGGDERITLDAIHGVNRYGCPPLAAPGLLDFGSCTASVISAGAFQAADALRRKIQLALSGDTPDRIYERELERMRGALLALSGLGELAEPDVIFAASGTDLHRIAALLSHAATTRPVLALMVEEAETGSGVHDALVNSRFGTEVATVALRAEDGTPRSAAHIDADFERIAREATRQGFHVLLIQVDQSKTGMIAPSYACLEKLQLALGAQLDILVDACQFRISSVTLRACLARGYSVALTGSKFVSGPSFSGALMVPAQTATRLRELPLPAELAELSLSAEWPTGWSARDMLDSGDNLGLLLRWEAALYELRAFRDLNDADIKNFLRDFAAHLALFMRRHPQLESVAVPALDRHALSRTETWDSEQSIFPVCLRVRNGASFRTQGREALQDIFKKLPDARVACQIGQPVRLAEGRYALRLCLSARSVAEALAQGASSRQRVMDKATRVLEQILELSEARHGEARPAVRQHSLITSSCTH